MVETRAADNTEEDEKEVEEEEKEEMEEEEEKEERRRKAEGCESYRRRCRSCSPTRRAVVVPGATWNGGEWDARGGEGGMTMEVEERVPQWSPW